MYKFLLAFFSCFFLSASTEAQVIRPGWFITGQQDNLVVNQPIVEENEEDDEEIEEDTEVEVSKDEISLQQKRRLVFALEILKSQFKVPSKENIVLSPTLIYLTSVVIANGVVDRSFFEFSKIVSIFRMEQVNASLSQYINKKKDNFKIAIWGDVFSRHYRENVKKMFNVDMWNMSGSTDSINSWFNQNVHESDLLTSLTLEKEIVVSAIADFNDELVTPFYFEKSKEKIFHNVDGSDGGVMMMYQRSKMDYYEDNLMRAVRLPYRKGNVITFLLPKENINFYKFVENLDITRLRPQFKQDVWVDLFVPRFELGNKLDCVKKFYENYGVKNIFNPSHAFAKMVSYDTETNIYDIVMYSKFEFSDGQKGAKVPEVEEDVQMFLANRPFVFMINNADFIGVYTMSDISKVQKIMKQNATKEVVVKKRKNGAEAWYETQAGSAHR